MKNIKINSEKKELFVSANIALKKLAVSACVVGIITSFAGCNKLESKFTKIDNIYLVPCADSIYVLSKESIDYETAFKYENYDSDTHGRRFTILLNDSNRKISWQTEEVISIPLTKEGLETADLILTNAGQEPVSPCFEESKIKTK